MYCIIFNGLGRSKGRFLGFFIVKIRPIDYQIINVSRNAKHAYGKLKLCLIFIIFFPGKKKKIKIEQYINA